MEFYKIYFDNKKVIIADEADLSFKDHNTLFAAFDNDKILGDLVQLLLTVNSIETLYVYGQKLQEEKKHFSNNKYNWILLHDTDKRIRNEYQIKSIPHYVLLDTEGDIIKGNAPAPSNNVDHFLKQLIRKK